MYDEQMMLYKKCDKVLNYYFNTMSVHKTSEILRTLEEDDSEAGKIESMLQKRGLITSINKSLYGTAPCKITTEGKDFIGSGSSFVGILERERREESKLKIDLNLAELVLKDYPKTKYQASLSLKLAIVGAATGIAALLWQIIDSIIKASN